MKAYKDNTILSPQFKLKEELLVYMMENADKGTEFTIEQIYIIE